MNRWPIIVSLITPPRLLLLLNFFGKVPLFGSNPRRFSQTDQTDSQIRVGARQMPRAERVKVDSLLEKTHEESCTFVQVVHFAGHKGITLQRGNKN